MTEQSKAGDAAAPLVSLDQIGMDTHRRNVRDAYAQVAQASNGGGCCGVESSCCGVSDDAAINTLISTRLGYSRDELDQVPSGADMGLGCGNPKAIAALKPGGRFIIQDAFLRDREGLYPTEASLFAISMLLFTEQGNTYTVSETAKWLKHAGFVRIKPVAIRKGTEDWEDGIWEGSAPGPRPRMIANQKGSGRNRKGR